MKKRRSLALMAALTVLIVVLSVEAFAVGNENSRETAIEVGNGNNDEAFETAETADGTLTITGIDSSWLEN